MTERSLATLRVDLEPAAGRTVRVEVDYPEAAWAGFRAGGPPLPAVVLVHGFASFMRWGFFPLLSRRLAGAGFASVRFDMSSNGIGADLETFTERDAFARDTYSKQLEDLATVRARLGRGELSFVDPVKPALLGHSRGAGIALLHASEAGGIRTVLGWATITQVASWTAEKRRLWREQGYLEVPAHRGWQRMLPDVIDDADENRGRFNLRAAAGRIDCPVVFVHGTRDRGVAVTAIQEFAARFPSGQARVEVIEGGGHNFGSRHPLETAPPALTQAIEVSLAALQMPGA